MNVFILNGSPKGGASNTLQLTQAFVSGLKEVYPEAEVERLDVAQRKLQNCQGCFACWNKTPGRCIFQDGMEEILEKIRNADYLIWSFPLYHFSLPAEIKGLMDRQLPSYLPFMRRDMEFGGHPPRYEMGETRQVVISTCGFYTAEGNYTSVDAQFERIYGPGGYTPLYCGQGELFRVPQLRQRTEEYLGWVKQAGRELALGEIQPQTQKQLKQLLLPRQVFEELADASWGVEQSPGAGQGQTKVDPALSFTRQLAALYHKEVWPGKDLVLEMAYTDVDQTYQIVLGQHGAVLREGDFLPYTTRIETPLSLWKEIGSGAVDGRKALMEHRYQVKGDFRLMLHWEKYFGLKQGGSASPSGVGTKPTNLALMLVLWISMWVALPIHSLVGGLVSLTLCALFSVGWMRYRMTVFDAFTVCAVALLSLMSMLGLVPLIILLPGSYFLFGLMWMVTLLRPVPLSAWYSMYAYGGEEALENPLFLRTNRILTACWGGLYLVTPVWTYWLMQTPTPWIASILNGICPILLGLFTLWFSRWYPSHYATGE